jgi:hypothetical protein
VFIAASLNQRIGFVEPVGDSLLVAALKFQYEMKETSMDRRVV